MVSQKAACFSFVLIYCALWATCAFSAALSCDSCGRECASACGTRHFRTCCFNYLRKRSSTPPLAPPRGPTTMEFPWLAKSHHRDLLEPPPLDTGRTFADNNDLLEYVEVIRESSGSGAASDNKRNSLIASHSSGHGAKLRRPRPLGEQGDRDLGHESEMKTSEETDPGRLQMLYDV